MKTLKKKLRMLIRQRKALYSASTLKELSDVILAKLEEEETFRKAKTILLYFSMEDEVQTHHFIEKWSTVKDILLPVVTGNELELRRYSGANLLTTGGYGIKEPIGDAFTTYNAIDLVIVPGMAFSHSGRRLGRGKGYYDKLLPAIQAPRFGICFPFQIIEDIPREDFDISMNKVITC